MSDRAEGGPDPWKPSGTTRAARGGCCTSRPAIMDPCRPAPATSPAPRGRVGHHRRHPRSPVGEPVRSRRHPPRCLARPDSAREPAPRPPGRARVGSDLRRERPQVLHCHDSGPGILGRIVGRLTGTRVIVNTVDGFPGGMARHRLPILAAQWFAARWSRLEFYATEEDLAWARRRGIAVAGRSRSLARAPEPLATNGGSVTWSRERPPRSRGTEPWSDAVRRATDADAVAIAWLHRDTMPDASLPRLGDPFLLRFHRAFIHDREATVLVAGSAGRVVGFASGVPSTRRFAARFALRHGAPGLLDLAVGEGVRGAFRRIAESARYATSSSDDGPEGGELIAVAVIAAGAATDSAGRCQQRSWRRSAPGAASTFGCWSVRATNPRSLCIGASGSGMR